MSAYINPSTLFFFSLTLIGCGQGVPLAQGAVSCAPGVYVQGPSIPCDFATSWVQYAEQETGFDLSRCQVQFVARDYFQGLDHAEAAGVIDVDTCSIAVDYHYPQDLVHEAIHAQRHTTGHCGWSSQSVLDLHRQAEVVGQFTDECQHVTCSSHGNAWTCN